VPRRTAPAIFVGCALLATAGCFGTGSQTDSASGSASASAPSSRSTQATEAGGSSSTSAEVDLPQGDEPVQMDPAEFTTDIDNPYWPMKPGTRWTYRETEGDTVLKVVVIATHQTKKMANGVTARVVRDTVTEDGELAEDTKDWYAQDQQGNIWYFGEQTAEFENGKLATREGSFESGVNGALPGIIIPAQPQPGMVYRQEYYKGQAEDNGAVLSTEEMVEAPYGFFRHALLTRDTNALEPKVLEYKLYARGVGPVPTLGASGGASREELLQVGQAPRSAGTGPLGRPSS
jgi:hypothetical protein